MPGDGGAAQPSVPVEMPNVWLPKMPLVVAAKTCVKPGLEPISMAPRPQPAGPYPSARATWSPATNNIEAAATLNTSFIDFIQIPLLKYNVKDAQRRSPSRTGQANASTSTHECVLFPEASSRLNT